MQRRYDNSSRAETLRNPSRYRDGAEWLAIYGALALIAAVVFGTAFTRLF
ncbi:MAG: hypothetical protein J0G95_08820 [Rhizobiales bacterium]|nr:hypothetical protein [Hyphomicrobiales bacterium]